MGRPVRVLFQGRMVEGEELDFEPLKESWNEYRCSDGSYVRIKLVVAKITRLNERTETGEPVYVVNSSNVLAVTPPPEASA